MSTGVALLHSMSAAACSRFVPGAGEVGRVQLEVQSAHLGPQTRQVAGVLTLAHQGQSPLGERDGCGDVAAAGLHDAGVPVGGRARPRRAERLGPRDRLAAEAYGVGGVAPLEVGGGDGDGELHGLVAGRQAGLLDLRHDALAALDGAAEVAGLAEDAAQGDAGLDRGQAVDRRVVDERLELQDGVVLVLGRLHGPRVEQAGTLAHAVHVRGRQRGERLVEVRAPPPPAGPTPATARRSRGRGASRRPRACPRRRGGTRRRRRAGRPGPRARARWAGGARTRCGRGSATDIRSSATSPWVRPRAWRAERSRPPSSARSVCASTAASRESMGSLCDTFAREASN